MKNPVLLMFALVFSICSATAMSVDPKNDRQMVKLELEQLVKDYTFELEEAVATSTTFTINKKNELVILTKNCEDEAIRYYLNMRLNYRKTETPLDKSGENKIAGKK
ncbi:hypothetical protein RM553_08690 [Zunongwangia sp. F363]|uniref:Uncharacterized protein n=1 Tax=Autumnicola tepida TaxID=3075595 RepID=A0ABU3C993_9FLAO|nr:hypothetical protein [Zunongwangia sp. F363]MDT0642905.1 hypothetical protein [Zunongwangia sp. F363]